MTMSMSLLRQETFFGIEPPLSARKRSLTAGTRSRLLQQASLAYSYSPAPNSPSMYASVTLNLP